MPRTLSPALLLVALLAACGGRDESDNALPQSLTDAVQQATDATRDRADGAEPVDAELLQARLPREVSGLMRVDVKREETGGLGMKISVTSARYEADNGRRVTIAISDLGGVGGIGSMGTAVWAVSDFDRTTSTGYERTTRFEGFKAVESLSRQGGSAQTEFNILIGDRFVVQMSGRGVEIDVLKDAARALDLRGLARAG